jgi:hypothetical protein
MKARALRIVWAAFLVACAAEFAVFAVVDPHDFTLLGRPLESGRTAAYSIFFLAFWAAGVASAALASFLAPR